MVMSAERVISYHNGNVLLRYCESENSTERVACMGYLAGLVDMGEMMVITADLPEIMCKPKEVPIQQLKAVFIAYARDNPESLHLSAVSIANAAFADAFPCSQPIGR